MTTRTGDILGELDVFEGIESLPHERHTYCITGQVDNPSLRAAISLFDDILGAPVQPYLLILYSSRGAAITQGSNIDDQSLFAELGAVTDWFAKSINDAASGRLVIGLIGGR